jgi:hypothetical protein
MLRSKKEKIRYRKGRLEIGKAVKLTENIGLESDGQMWSQFRTF